MKYRKKSVPVEAIQFTGINFFDCLRFMKTPEYIVNNLELKYTDSPVVHTPTGVVAIGKGDWIVRNERGDYEPYAAADFEATYEPE